MKAVVGALAGVFVLTGWVVSAAPVPTDAQDAAKIDAGRKVYETQKCAQCHMVGGKGAKMSVLDGVGSKLTAADIRKWIETPTEMEAKLATKPKIKMKAYKLEAADLDALVAYVSSLKK